MSGNSMMFGMTEKMWADEVKLWVKRAYWVFGIIVLLYVCYLLFSRNQQIAAVLVFLSGFIALYFYYVKWFVIPDRVPNWPPYTTPCPDFLTLVEPGDGETMPAKCMDFVGVSTGGPNAIRPVTPQNYDSLKNNGEYYFEVAKKYRDTATNEIKEYKLDSICENVKNAGLTWLSLCPDQ